MLNQSERHSLFYIGGMLNISLLSSQLGFMCCFRPAKCFNLFPKLRVSCIFATSKGSFKRFLLNAKVAQLVEHDLAKVGVASSNLVFRSTEKPSNWKAFLVLCYCRWMHFKDADLPWIMLLQLNSYNDADYSIYAIQLSSL
jgi:hypothetical protein